MRGKLFAKFPSESSGSNLGRLMIGHFESLLAMALPISRPPGSPSLASNRPIMASKKTNNGKTKQPREVPLAVSLPEIGDVLRRLRLQRGLTVRGVAEACDLSQSFISMVERGDSDISVVRLMRLAEFFEHDIGTLLGYGSRLSKPHFISKSDRAAIDRGPGVDYEVIHLPGLDIEINIIKIAPMRSFKDAISHEGFDIMYVTKGEVILSLGDHDYLMKEGDCVYYSAAYRHRLINKSPRPVMVVAITTGKMH